MPETGICHNCGRTAVLTIVYSYVCGEGFCGQECRTSYRQRRLCCHCCGQTEVPIYTCACGEPLCGECATSRHASGADRQAHTINPEPAWTPGPPASAP